MGVVFELDPADKQALDNFEGLGHGYDEQTVEVRVDGTPMTVTLYFATDIDSSLRPYDWYKALVVAGAREHRLPAEYIRMLEAVPSVADPKPARTTEHMALNSRGWPATRTPLSGSWKFHRPARPTGTGRFLHFAAGIALP